MSRGCSHSPRRDATRLAYPDEVDFVVLRDPDGNEFCMVDHS